MNEIAKLIAKYPSQHDGRFPERLSQLVAKGQALDIFYVTCSKSAVILPEGYKEKWELLDTFSPYGFLRLPDGRILVFERTVILLDGRVGFCILENSGESSRQRIPREQFVKEYLQNLHP